MRLHVLASGSSGNGYVLYNDCEALVIECGVPYVRCLKAIGFHREKIVGALVSHEHGDHCKYVGQYLGAGIPVYASSETIGELSIKENSFPPNPVSNKTLYQAGGFRFLPFDVRHDCAEPFGFLIHHEEMGQVLFATDTYYLPYTFGNLSHIMLECNYETGIIDRNVENKVIPPFYRERVHRSHMSLETNISTLKSNDLSAVNTVVLLHLSHNNSDPELFKRKVEEETGKLVFVADKGMDIPFNKSLI